MTKVLFPGTFDPITKGHLDLLKRAATMFDEVSVVLMVNHEKKTLLDQDIRLRLLKESLQDISNVIVDVYDGLTVQYAKEHDLHILIRGVRSIADYEYELQVASVNKQLDEQLETLLLFASADMAFVSSSNMKAVAVQQGDISSFVEPHVEKVIKKIYQNS